MQIFPHRYLTNVPSCSAQADLLHQDNPPLAVGAVSKETNFNTQEHIILQKLHSSNNSGQDLTA